MHSPIITLNINNLIPTRSIGNINKNPLPTSITIKHQNINLTNINEYNLRRLFKRKEFNTNTKSVNTVNLIRTNSNLTNSTTAQTVNYNYKKKKINLSPIIKPQLKSRYQQKYDDLYLSLRRNNNQFINRTYDNYFSFC